jgi:hypothetical protein
MSEDPIVITEAGRQFSRRVPPKNGKKKEPNDRYHGYVINSELTVVMEVQYFKG